MRRLKQVCRKEGISTSERALKTMTDLLQRDVRSCLHMLQFVHRQQSRLSRSGRTTSMSEEELCRYAAAAASSGATGGMASDTSIFQSLRDLFYVGKQRGPASKVASKTTDVWDYSSQLIRLHGGRDGCDFLHAMHENCLSVGLSDPTLKRSAYMIDLITDSMECYSLAKSKQQYTWLKYVPSAVFAARNVFKANVRGGFHNSRFVFERLDSSSSRLRSQRVDLLRTFISNAHLALGTRAPRSFVLDMLSSYVSLLRPRLTSRGATTGSWQLLSADDHSTLRNVVQLMACTGVTYKASFENQMGDDGNRYQRQQFGHTYVLEPNVESLTTFKFTEAPEKVEDLSDPMKKFLKREIQNVVIRGRFASEPKKHRHVEQEQQQRSQFDKSDDGSTHQSKKVSGGWRKYITKPNASLSPQDRVMSQSSRKGEEDATKRMRKDGEKMKRPGNFLQRARAAAMKQKRRRLRSKSSVEDEESRSSSSKNENHAGCGNSDSIKKVKSCVTFRFEEGFSSAVRRPVTVVDFLEKHDPSYAAARSPSKLFF